MTAADLLLKSPVGCFPGIFLILSTQCSPCPPWRSGSGSDPDIAWHGGAFGRFYRRAKLRPLQRLGGIRLQSSLRFLSLLALALSAAQAFAAPEIVQRGSDVFQSQCIRCHVNAEMTARLEANWKDKKADELFQRIKATMPA